MILPIIIITLILIITFIITLKDPINGLFLIIFFLPFERIPSYDLPFRWGITIRISQVIALVTILVIIIKILQKKIKFKLELQDLFFLFYIFIAGLSIFFAINQIRAILIWLFTVFTVLVYWIVKSILNSEKQLYKIENIFFWSTLLVVFFGLYQFFGDLLNLPIWLTGLREFYTKDVFGFPRIQSVALEPLYFANFLLIPFSIFICLFLKRQNQKSNFKVLFLLFFIILNLVLTLSRGGFIATVSILILSFILFLRKDNIKQGIKVLLITASATLLAICLIYLGTWISGNINNARNFSKQAVNIDQGISVTGRVIMRLKAIEAFKKHPILGVGIGNFGSWLEANYSDLVSDETFIVNNETLEILAETGILGFLSLIIALGYLFIKSFKFFYKAKNLYIKTWLGSLLIILVGIAIQYQTFSTLYIMHIWVVIGLTAAVNNLSSEFQR